MVDRTNGLGVSAPARAIAPRLAAIAVVTVAAAAVATGGFAQTLIEPNAPPKSAPPPAKKPHPTARDLSCSAMGAGFVKVPGTDACVKIGGWVNVDGGSR
jgi:hypothetical protein